MTTSPPPDVLAAFGTSGAARRLTGGQGGTWQAGDVVLKPVGSEAETAWRSEVLSALPDSPDFCVARPVASSAGAWTVSGWEATRWAAGATDPSRADDVIRAGVAFHAAVAALPRPAFLDERRDPWAWGDRLAFGEPVPAGSTAPSALLEPLLAASRPVGASSQLVHGDLTGNVLFADGRPPTIIDWSAYWRPPAWAASVVAVDARTRPTAPSSSGSWPRSGDESGARDRSPLVNPRRGGTPCPSS